MTAISAAAGEIAQAALECGERVATLDTTGSAVTLDLYALGLRAATRRRVHPVRALTAAIDVLIGLRDFIRGPKPGLYFGACYVAHDLDEWKEMFA